MTSAIDTLPRLSAAHLEEAVSDTLPVRAVQFGTGALLRGLVDDALDGARRKGMWDGRVVAVSQTGSGRGAAFNDQDGLFTLRERGVDPASAQPVEHVRIIASVSRALSATDDWDAVLNLARDPGVSVVVSNTTEVGLTWDDADDPQASPPQSFPARLAAFLHAREQADAPPLVVLPTELVEHNGPVLRDLVLRWGERAGWGEPFAAFVRTCLFCETLVDRIVTGTPSDLEAAERDIGYRDPLLTDAEVYRLWAIEAPEGTSPEALAERLGFAEPARSGDGASASEGVVVAPSIEPFRLRKVRLLNAAHTLLVPVALGCGMETVRQSVEDARVGAYVRRLMADELVPAVAADLEDAGYDGTTAAPFAESVLARFANPYLRHDLTAITLHQTTKLAVRAIPSALSLARSGATAQAISFGIAALLLLHRTAAGALDGPTFGHPDLLEDGRSDAIRDRWRAEPDDPTAVIRSVLADVGLWGHDLTTVTGLEDDVQRHGSRMLAVGVPAALDDFLVSAEVQRLR